MRLVAVYEPPAGSAPGPDLRGEAPHLVFRSATLGSSDSVFTGLQRGREGDDPNLPFTWEADFGSYIVRLPAEVSVVGGRDEHAVDIRWAPEPNVFSQWFWLTRRCALDAPASQRPPAWATHVEFLAGTFTAGPIPLPTYQRLSVAALLATAYTLDGFVRWGIEL
ncbi:hypothetical protein [Polyangium fumosum]|uniref:hypothetical protein n=1 Tax=Polyangium fumosum TaxID=889272 RepID=UPI0010ADFF8A|nr:hypothetical protein [Polyangium fumosum]